MKFVLVLILILGFSLFAQSNESCMECHSDTDLTGMNLQNIEIPMSMLNNLTIPFTADWNVLIVIRI